MCFLILFDNSEDCWDIFGQSIVNNKCDRIACMIFFLMWDELYDLDDEGIYDSENHQETSSFYFKQGTMTFEK